MSARKRGLGRGLDALLGSTPAPAPSSSSSPPGSSGAPPGSSGASPSSSSSSASAPAPAGASATPTVLPLEDLVPNRLQPRSNFDADGIDELAASIRSQGVVQPIIVTRSLVDEGAGNAADGRYTIVAGERRWRAARRAGLRTVPVVVREVEDDRQLLELALVENLQRADLDAIEEAEAYRALADRFQLSHQEIGVRVGKSRPAIANALRLLRLPSEVQEMLRAGRLTAGQARPLLALGERKAQIGLAERAAAEGLSARSLEALCSAPPAPAPEKKKKKEAAEVDVNTRAAAERLTRALQTRVEIKRRRRGGEVRIHFHSEDELIRLFDHLIQAKGD